MHQVFTVYDTKSQAYLQPFFLQTEGQAIRAIADCVNDPEHQFARHPGDYTLFALGTFNDEIAKFNVHETPRALHVLVELVTPSRPTPTLLDKMEA